MEQKRMSKIKKKRKSGFLVRMQSKKGRKIINRKRRFKRSTNVR